MANDTRQMYPATCAQCGRGTQVPFEPKGDRPVYCKECYQKRTGQDGAPAQKQRGVSLSTLKPHGPRPVQPAQGGQSSLSAQLSALSAKLDMIIAMLGSGSRKAAKSGAKRAAKKEKAKKKR